MEQNSKGGTAAFWKERCLEERFSKESAQMVIEEQKRTIDNLLKCAEQQPPITSVNQKGGIWVKASERLPDNDSLMYLKIDGESKRLGIFFVEDSRFLFNIAGYDFIIDSDKFENLEWLDENITPVNSQEDWIKRLLNFCHFLGKEGYKINGYDDGQLIAVINNYLQNNK